MKETSLWVYIYIKISYWSIMSIVIKSANNQSAMSLIS